MKASLTYCLIALLVPIMMTGQSVFKMPEGQVKETLRFKFINNLIIIPVEVNGVELSFLLDSGVNKPILFNISENDSLQMRNIQEIYLRGLGRGEATKAYISRGNEFKVENITNKRQDIYVIMDPELNFSPRLGFPVHGIIGFDLFRDFVVDINYISHKIRFYERANYKKKKCKKCREFDLELVNNKPYILGSVALEGKEETRVKLLVDSGSSDALWLFPNKTKNIEIPEKSFRDFLGRGLSGSIFGKRSRVDRFSLADFHLEKAKVAFPDSLSIKYLKNLKGRNGSLGSEMLKRFHVTFDYQGKKLMLRKNGNFNEPFKYNMSGIELQHNGLRYVRELGSSFGTTRSLSEANANTTSSGVQVLLGDRFKLMLYPSFEIAEIRESSPAAISGLRTGDVILSVNGKQAHRYSLHEIVEMINRKEGQRVKLKVDRGGKKLNFYFQLKKVL